MEIKIISITPSLQGEEVLIKVDLSDNGRIQHASGEVATDLYAELDLPYSIYEPYSITREQYVNLEYSMKLTDAIKAGINLIAFSQNTKRSIYQKLVVRGFQKEMAMDAADYLERVGYINEYDMAIALINDMAVNRLYGRLRIKNELIAKGIGSETIKNAFDDSDIDYVASCAKRIKVNHMSYEFENKQEFMKFMASLNRSGFTVEEIKQALLRIQRENN